MSTIQNQPAGGDAEALADAQSVAACVCAGKPVPAEVAQRVLARADQTRQETLARHGGRSFSVQVIREMRGPIDEDDERELTLAQRDLLRNGDPRLVDPDSGETYLLVRETDYVRLIARSLS